ncbi:MAG: thiamine-phosphate kinase [Cyanobacteria bacterium P01_H01_bin.21]
MHQRREHEPTVAELGEHEILKRLRQFCTDDVGDDGAVRSLPAGAQLVVTTDVLVDGVHFSDRTLPPEALGWRAAAVNLSDLAAMGATPMGLTIGLTLPPATPWVWVESLYQGFTDCLHQYGGAIIGGDLCRGSHRSLAITALGCVRQALYRHRAQANQTLVATGVHGASRAGLALLLDELNAPESFAQTWIRAHQYPIPRFEAIALLQNFDRIAGMDTSDGLADAVIQICRQSQIGARLLRSQLPVPPGLIETVGQSTAEQWTLYGGEDFELVLSLPPDIANGVVSALPSSQIIGYTTPETEIRLVDDMANGADIQLDQNQGFQHFSS